jgi:YHS domain-containing protein
VTFRFSKPEHKALFDAAPEKYIPQFGGYCTNGIAYGIPWGGDANNWEMIGGKLYMFGGQGSHDAFNLHPAENMKLAEKYWTEEVNGSNAFFQRSKRLVFRVPHYKSGAELAAEGRCQEGQVEAVAVPAVAARVRERRRGAADEGGGPQDVGREHRDPDARLEREARHPEHPRGGLAHLRAVAHARQQHRDQVGAQPGAGAAAPRAQHQALGHAPGERFRGGRLEGPDHPVRAIESHQEEGNAMSARAGFLDAQGEAFHEPASCRVEGDARAPSRESARSGLSVAHSSKPP